MLRILREMIEGTMEQEEQLPLVMDLVKVNLEVRGSARMMEMEMEDKTEVLEVTEEVVLEVTEEVVLEVTEEVVLVMEEDVKMG